MSIFNDFFETFDHIVNTINSNDNNAVNYKIELNNDNGVVSAKINGKDVDWGNEDQIKELHNYIDNHLNIDLYGPFKSFFSNNALDFEKESIHKMIDNHHQEQMKLLEAKKQEEEEQNAKEQAVNDLVDNYINSINDSDKLSNSTRNNISAILKDFIKFAETKNDNDK